MSWPWVSRRSLDAAESRLRWTEKELAHTEGEKAAVEHLAVHRLERCDRLEADNKLLFDRIMQMTGQPPIFHPGPAPAIVAEPKAPESSAIPAPTLRPSFDDVKRKARTAIDSNALDRPKLASR